MSAQTKDTRVARAFVAECYDGFDCPHGRHYTNRHDAENCPHGDYDGPPLDAEIYHRAAGHDVREVKP